MTHLIAQSRQRRDEPAYTICDCGHRADGDTPEQSAAAFAAHRREMRATHDPGPKVQPQVRKGMRISPGATPDRWSTYR